MASLTTTTRCGDSIGPT